MGVFIFCKGYYITVYIKDDKLFCVVKFIYHLMVTINIYILNVHKLITN